MSLPWLPRLSDFRADLKSAAAAGGWAPLYALAHHDLAFIEVLQLDLRLMKFAAAGEAGPSPLIPLKVAVLASCTVAQLFPGIRIAGARHGFAISIYECDFGQYAQELLDPTSGLHAFRPDVVVFALDEVHLFGLTPVPDGAVDAALSRLRGLWSEARKAFNCQVVQQTLMPTQLRLVGNNEHRFPASIAAATREFNWRLRAAADETGIDVLAIDERISVDGRDAWFSPALWLRAKQMVAPQATALYGELVVRLIGAQRGHSAKCLVLDLDNTLWGGVIGDDGLQGIVLGQGSAVGEAFTEFQTYVASLAKRGVLLAVCSKNDEANALEPFFSHPEMVLKREDISAFVANWQDKASNIRQIAQTLNIGLDAMVFVDDNPFERNIVRQELPMVRVPELPEDPALYATCLSDAAYFESTSLTAEDLTRTKLYQARSQAAAALENATDLNAYLGGLDMVMTATAFDAIGLSRITQLANKTNQFNLTTRRYTDGEMAEVLHDPQRITLQVRLKDRFADHGIIGLIIANQTGKAAEIETWLMSCRVLGRGVEQACLSALLNRCRSAGVEDLRGEYKPTAKNGMVADLYPRLGFEAFATEADAEDGAANWSLHVPTAPAFSGPIKILEN